MRLVVLVLALLADTARAFCSSPSPIVLPLEGSTLPPDPQLYLFVPDQVRYRGEPTPNEKALAGLTVTAADGKSLPFVLDRLVNSEVDVYRLSVRAAAGTRLVVRPFQTRLSTLATVGKVTTLNVERGPERNYRWTCSYESTRVLLPSLDAPAFKITWDEELRDVDSEGARWLIVPGRDAWHARGGAEKEPQLLRLGHLNCAFTNLEWSKPIFVRVTALMADGTEVRSRQILRLEPPPRVEELDTW